VAMSACSRVCSPRSTPPSALSDAASLLKLHDVDREEEAVARALASGTSLNDAVPDPTPLDALDSDANDFVLSLGQDVAPVPPVADRQGLFDSEVDFLRECLNEAFPNPSAGPKSGGVGWTEHRDEDLVELVPPDELMARLRFLAQTYLTQRRVKEKLLLAVTPPSAGCRSSGSSGDTVDDTVAVRITGRVPT
jgi:hypothetical protein